MLGFLLKLALFSAVGVVWLVTAKAEFSVAGNFAVILGAPLAVFPAVWAGRRLLDREPTAANARFVTTYLHALLVLLYGTAVIRALRMFSEWHGWTIPIPHSAALALLAVTTAAMTLTVVNLALCAFGAPFAIALSRRLVSDWCYRYTRNPMVLTTLFWFVAIGLEMQSASFLFWVLFVAAPAEYEYLKRYEERELELRFGEDYLAYKAKTPFLWPRQPRNQARRGLAQNSPVT